MPPSPSAKIIQAEPGSTSQHFQSSLSFPIYSLQFISSTSIILAGGGGSSKSGIMNRLSVYDVDLGRKELRLREEFQLSREEDAPMTVALHRNSKLLACGINSDVETLKRGTNENLRLFTYTDKDDEATTKIKFERKLQTLKSHDPDQYQKVTSFSRPTSSTSPLLLAIGSTCSQLSLHKITLPQPGQSGEGKQGEGEGEGEEVGLKVENVWPTKNSSIGYDGEEVFDVDFNDEGDMLVGTSSTKLCVWSTTGSSSSTTTTATSSKEGDEKKGIEGEEEVVMEPLQVIERPVLKKELACTFRSAKFGRKSTSTNLYTIVNASPSSSSSGRGKKRGSGGNGNKKSFVSLWDTKSWKLLKTRTIGLKPTTAFDVSEDGLLLAYGSSDLSIGILDAITLRPITTILHAHDFPVTSLKFNPEGTILVSGSADNTVRIVKVPAVGQRGGDTSKYWIILTTLLILVLAILVQQGYIDREVWNVARGSVVN